MTAKKVALHPHEHRYLRNCRTKNLTFFKEYSREECYVECSYRVIMAWGLTRAYDLY